MVQGVGQLLCPFENIFNSQTKWPGIYSVAFEHIWAFAEFCFISFHSCL